MPDLQTHAMDARISHAADVPSKSQPSQHPIRRLLLSLAVLALIGSALVFSTGSDGFRSCWNFAYLHTGAECLVDRCDPYNADALNREAHARGESSKGEIDFASLVYPPSSLLLTAPFEGLGWPAAVVLFDSLSVLAMAWACLLLIGRFELERQAAATALLLATLIGYSMWLAIPLGNPALLSVALAAIATFLLWDRPLAQAGWLMLGFALALKPQIALGPAVFLLWRPETRSAAARAWALFVLLLAAAVLAYGIRLGSFHYLSQFVADVRLSLVPGGLSDSSPKNGSSYDFLNLQALLLRVLPVGTVWADRIAWTITAAFAALIGWLGERKGDLRKRPWTILALLVLISLMPVYHRGYDRLIALLMVPAVVELSERRRRIAWIVATVAVVWQTGDLVTSYVLRRWITVSINPAAELTIIALLLLSLRPRRDTAARIV